MAEWNSGYVTEIDYTHGFYREMTPELLNFALLSRGVKNQADKLTFCDLGCGQGFSANLLAAANPDIDFHATDFNPTQIAGAKALARNAGTSNVSFYDTAFADFANQPGLPDSFDVIALHGVFSWISAENRAAIIDFIARKLAVGGLVYVSYNCLPALASSMPLRRLLADHAAGQNGPIGHRIDNAIAFAEKLSGQARNFTANPDMLKRLNRMKGEKHAYLAHEFFNRDWTPFYSADIAADLGQAKLSFAGSAHLLDHVDFLNLTGAQQGMLAGEQDPVRRETLRDFITNTPFRRDIFVKGPLQHTPLSQREAWLQTRFALSVAPENFPMAVTGFKGKSTLEEHAFRPLINAFSAGPRTLQDILASDQTIAALGWDTLMRMLPALVGSGHLHPSRPAKGDARRKETTAAFNLAVAEHSRSSDELKYLASPVTGGGIPVDRLDQQFLSAHMKAPANPAAHIWTLFKQQNIQMVYQGRKLDTDAENIAEIERRYSVFETRRLPVYSHLGLA